MGLLKRLKCFFNIVLFTVYNSQIVIGLYILRIQLNCLQIRINCFLIALGIVINIAEQQVDGG